VIRWRRKVSRIAGDRPAASLYVIAAPGEISGSAVMLDSAYLIHSIFSHTGAQVYSTAILLMPPIAPRDPNSEALAYASLKELNHSIEKHTFTLHLPRQDKTFDFPAFNNGIFLVETGMSATWL